MSAIPKHARPLCASQEINARELAWWQENGSLMSRLWDYDTELNSVIRGQYLDRAKAFLTTARSARILELGCGSGWLGRSLAGPDISIVGVDFCQAQVAAAEAAAALHGQAGNCRYVCLDGLDAFDAWDEVDGVLIHAFLHHLDQSELERTLDLLRDNLKPGSRIWIYEPALYKTPAKAPAELEADAARQLAICEKLKATLASWLLENDLIQRDKYDRFLELWTQSEQQGWYLSPKEVPLCIEDFTEALTSRFTLRDSWWATIRIIAWVFEINLVTDRNLRSFLVQRFAPLLAATDRSLATQKAWLRATMVGPDHAFYVWECQV